MLRLQQNGEFQFGDVGMYSYSTLKPLNYVYDNEFHSILLQYGGLWTTTKVYWDGRDIETYIDGLIHNRHQRGFAWNRGDFCLGGARNPSAYASSVFPGRIRNFKVRVRAACP